MLLLVLLSLDFVSIA